MLPRSMDNSTIVFGGYEQEHSTKAYVHLRRLKVGGSTDVKFQPSTPIVLKKEDFLANSRNKQQFINFFF
jgi:hypothetical protein